MGTIESVGMWCGEILPFLASLAAFGCGVRRFFKKGKALYLQSLTMAFGCHALCNVYRICNILTSGQPFEGFTPAYLGNIGFFLFLIASSYGQLDRIVDDGSAPMRPARRLAFIAPVAVALLYLPILISDRPSLTTKLLLLLVWVTAVAGSYFNLKHFLIPDLDFGFVKAIKPYNALALCLVGAELVCLISKCCGLSVLTVISAAAFGVFSLATIVAAQRGSEKWTI